MKHVLLASLFLCFQGQIAQGQYGFEGQTFIFNAYFDDLPNPGYQFSFREGKMRLELPRLGIYDPEEGIYIRKVIDEPYILQQEGKFLYAALTDSKFLILSNGEDVCVLVDLQSKDSFWGLRNSSPYISIKTPGLDTRGNYIGLQGGNYSTLQMSSVLTEKREGKEVRYDLNMQGRYNFDLNTPWVEGASGNGIGEWVSIAIAYETNEILLLNGFIDVTRPDLFEVYARVKRISILTNRGEWCFELSDSPNPQVIRLPDVVTGRIVFTIVDVFPGRKDKNTAISAIYFLTRYPPERK